MARSELDYILFFFAGGWGEVDSVFGYMDMRIVYWLVPIPPPPVPPEIIELARIFGLGL